MGLARLSAGSGVDREREEPQSYEGGEGECFFGHQKRMKLMVLFVGGGG